MRAKTRYMVIVNCMTLALLSIDSPATGQAGGPLPIGFFGNNKVAADKKDPSKLPHIGAWRINLGKSDPALWNRFSPTATNIFTVENGGIRHDIFQVYPPKV